MTQIQLLVSTYPPQAEVYANFRRKNGSHILHVAVMDTGAQISTFPEMLLADLEHRISNRSPVHLEQAGMGRQYFTAIEAYITIFLEDALGNRTPEFEILAWFTDTSRYLAGFGGVLERCVLHLDTPHLSGYLDYVGL